MMKKILPIALWLITPQQFADVLKEDAEPVKYVNRLSQ